MSAQIKEDCLLVIASHSTLEAALTFSKADPQALDLAIHTSPNGFFCRDGGRFAERDQSRDTRQVDCTRYDPGRRILQLGQRLHLRSNAQDTSHIKPFCASNLGQGSRGLVLVAHRGRGGGFGSGAHLAHLVESHKRHRPTKIRPSAVAQCRGASQPHKPQRTLTDLPHVAKIQLMSQPACLCCLSRCFYDGLLGAFSLALF